MKVGDLVTVIGSQHRKELTGIVLEEWIGCGGWWTVMTDDGVINWPGSKMVVISASR